MNIGYVAGTSGGHINPLISLSMKHKAESLSIQNHYFFTTNKSIDLEVITAAPKNVIDFHLGYNLENVPYLESIFKKIWYGVKVIYIFFLSLIALWKFDIQEIYTTGSYIAIPFTLAAKVMRIPIHLYHLDENPGRAGKLIHFYATDAFICFEKTRDRFKKYSTPIFKILYPIRFNSSHKISSENAKKILNISLDKKVILILGGSQGALKINNDVINKLKEIDSSNYYILHQTGKDHYEYVQNAYKKIGIKSDVFSYASNIDLYYNAADFIIARAGAGTLAEIVFFKKKALIIPLKNFANNHQENNAISYLQEYPDLITVSDSVYF